MLEGKSAKASDGVGKLMDEAASTFGEHLSIKEEISPEETQMAEELRSHCDRFGKEKRESLRETAGVLFNMGKLYLQKAITGEGMLQKITYIRCSALLNGAKVRYKLLRADDQLTEVDDILVELNRSLLKSSGKANADGRAMLKFSEEKVAKIKQLREDTNKKAAGISAGSISNEQKAAETDKIARVLELNKQTTQNYLLLMQDISKKVQKILGPPLCKFAIVGLGSLARQEITLYSDFEHVIILEDDVEQKTEEEYYRIREYFRWFTVIFEVIFIGFGETFIRSVGVKSINDLYSEDKTKNWFYDIYTPCGIAFDGMVPHSCNTPLGRQEHTKERKHVVELIQPATKMAKFLTHDEELKNGYYLKDVLARTCLVYGSEEIYGVFLRESKEILNSEHMSNVVRKELQKFTENRIKGVRGIGNLENHQRLCDVKSVVYRPVTALLAYFARIKGICDEVSSFDIALRLEKDGVIEGQFARKLKHAIAVACEVRMKAYASTGNERNAMTMSMFAELVGKQSAINSLFVVEDLKLRIMNCVRDLVVLNEDETKTHEAEIMIAFGDFKAALELSEIMMKKHELPLDLENRLIPLTEINLCMTNACLIHTCCFHLGGKDPDPINEYYTRCEKMCLFILAHDFSDLRKMTCCRSLCGMFTRQGRYREATQAFENWQEFYHHVYRSLGDLSSLRDSYGEASEKWVLNHPGRSVLPKFSSLNVFLLRMCDISSRGRVIGTTEMLEYLQNQLEREDDLKSKYLLRCHIAIQRIKLGDRKIGRRELLQVLTELIRDAPNVGTTVYKELLRVIWGEQFKRGWNYDSSIAIFEEYELMKSMQSQSGVDISSQYSDQETQDLTYVYQEKCKWRRDNNLPLENSKLNIWEEYERKSPGTIGFAWRQSVDSAEHSQRFSHTHQGRGDFLDSYFSDEQRLASDAYSSGQSDTVTMYRVPVSSSRQSNNEQAARILWGIINKEKKESNVWISANKLLMQIIQSRVKKSFN